VTTPLHVRAWEAYRQEIERLPEDAHLDFDEFLIEFIDAETYDFEADLPQETGVGYKPNHDFDIPF